MRVADMENMNARLSRRAGKQIVGAEVTRRTISSYPPPYVGAYSCYSFFPVKRSYASKYFALVLATTSSGNFGPGGVLFQSSVSR